MNDLIKKHLPKTFYAGLGSEERLKMLVKHWQRAIEINHQLEQMLKERDEALQDATLHFTQRTFSTRPCTTCDLVSKIIKKPFGCKELNK